MAITLVFNPEHLGGMTAPEDGERPVYPVRLYMVFTHNKHTQTCLLHIIKYMYTQVYLYYHLFDPSASRSNFHLHAFMNTITVCNTCTYVPIDIPWHLFKNIIL